VAFAQQAIVSSPAGMVLDAGCGSFLFTAQGYVQCERPILAFDQSLQMLRRARSRLIELAGSVPDRILLLQADLSAMPFRPGSFHTVICMNVLHHITDGASLIQSLKNLLVDGGHLYLTSLVKANRLIGDQYISALYRRGDLIEPRTGPDLQDLLAGSFGQQVNYRMRGNMAFAMAPAFNGARVSVREVSAGVNHDGGEY
jgi:SAM-dependent methyltransferase